MFDRRLDDEDAVVRSYNEHTSWVQKACWDPNFDGHIISARLAPLSQCMGGSLTVFDSLDGEIKLFDIRGSDNALATWTPHPGGLSAFDVHPQAGVFAR